MLPSRRPARSQVRACSWSDGEDAECHASWCAKKLGVDVADHMTLFPGVVLEGECA
jgi:hypothetical protein